MNSLIDPGVHTHDFVITSHRGTYANRITHTHPRKAHDHYHRITIGRLDEADTTYTNMTELVVDNALSDLAPAPALRDFKREVVEEVEL